MKATIILADGSKVSLDIWQGIYGLPTGSSQIGKYIRIGEKDRNGKVVIEDGCELAEWLIRLFDKVRAKRAKATYINSAGRSNARQNQLIANGERAASQSTHVVNMAFDVDTLNADETKQLVRDVELSAKELGIKVRIGWKEYMKEGKTFVHMDVAPEYYSKGKPYNHIKHPEPWEREVRW